MTIAEVTGSRGVDDASFFFEKLGAALLRELTLTPDEGVDDYIRESIRRMAEALGFNLAAVGVLSPEAGEGVVTHVWSSDESLRGAIGATVSNFPWSSPRLQGGESFCVRTLDGLPEEARGEKGRLESAGVRSICCCPVRSGSRVIGGLVLARTRPAEAKDCDLHHRLHLCGEIVATALGRRRAHTWVRESIAFERLLADLLASLVEVPAGDLEGRIEDAMRQVGEFFGIDRCSFLEYRADEGSLVMVHAYVREGISRPPSGLDRVDIPSVMRRVEIGECVVIRGLADLPVESERKIWLREGLQSVVLVPVTSRGRILGAFELTCVRSERVWTDGVIQRLRLAADALGSALGRKHADDSLRETQREYRLIADSSADWIYWERVDGSLAYISPSAERVTGYAGSELMASPQRIIDIVHRDDMDTFMWHSPGQHEPPSGNPIEFRIHRRDGEVRWIEHSCRRLLGDRGEDLGIRVTNRDITPRKQAEIALESALSEVQNLKNQLEAENVYLREEIRERAESQSIVGESEALLDAMAKARKVAPSGSNVLITGETGTGKELLAQMIHDLSPRAQRSIVKVNCAALPAPLIESELFGREKGAYTGALTKQAGRFEAADGSTIFLDEVGELPLELQAKLLRVLQEGRFERLGSNETIRVDARVIAASNRDLGRMVREGGFRVDLYYRLNVFPIEMPPLRNRPDDIPMLVWRFTKEFSERVGKNVSQIPSDVLRRLVAHPWPGNVRELRNVIERAVILTEGRTLQLDSFSVVDPDVSAGPDTLEAVERRHILGVLERTGWRISGAGGAASILGLRPTTLHSRLRKLGVVRPKG